MQLNYRIGQKQDFTAFYENCYYPHRKNVELRRVMKHEWDTFTSNSTTLTLVIDDSLAPEETRLVGCGQVVFVSDAFARHAKHVGHFFQRVAVTVAQPETHFQDFPFAPA